MAGCLAHGAYMEGGKKSHARNPPLAKTTPCIRKLLAVGLGVDSQAEPLNPDRFLGHSRLQFKGLIGTLKKGLATLWGARAVLLMMKGFKRNTITLSAFTFTKP